MTKKRPFTYEIKSPLHGRLVVTIMAASREEAERLLWQKIEAQSLDALPNPFADDDDNTKKGLPQ
jgi:hypothetical protein